jgi:hypothetical protein
MTILEGTIVIISVLTLSGIFHAFLGKSPEERSRKKASD